MMSDQTDVHTIEDEIVEILASVVRLRARPRRLPTTCMPPGCRRSRRWI